MLSLGGKQSLFLQPLKEALLVSVSVSNLCTKRFGMPFEVQIKIS